MRGSTRLRSSLVAPHGAWPCSRSPVPRYRGMEVHVCVGVRSLGLLRDVGARLPHRRPVVAYPLMRALLRCLPQCWNRLLREWRRRRLPWAFFSSAQASSALLRRPKPASACRHAVRARQCRDHRRLYADRWRGRPRIGNAASYAAWLTFLEAIRSLSGYAGGAAATRSLISRGWRRGLIGGAASLGAYAIVLWAMTRAPVAASPRCGRLGAVRRADRRRLAEGRLWLAASRRRG